MIYSSIVRETWLTAPQWLLVNVRNILQKFREISELLWLSRISPVYYPLHCVPPRLSEFLPEALRDFSNFFNSSSILKFAAPPERFLVFSEVYRTFLQRNCQILDLPIRTLEILLGSILKFLNSCSSSWSLSFSLYLVF